MLFLVDRLLSSPPPTVHVAPLLDIKDAQTHFTRNPVKEGPNFSFPLHGKEKFIGAKNRMNEMFIMPKVPELHDETLTTNLQSHEFDSSSSKKSFDFVDDDGGDHLVASSSKNLSPRTTKKSKVTFDGDVTHEYKGPPAPDFKMTLANGSVLDLFIRRKETINNENMIQITKKSEKPIYQLLNRLDSTVSSKGLPNKISSADTDDGIIDVLEGQLWVDKYSPEKFTDLLSHDKDNLQVLQWLTLWKDTTFPSIDKIKKNSSSTTSKFFRNSSTHRQSEDFKKILLISGSPGLGKTTLAHIVAKMCGYNVIEMNASDARSATTSLKDKITSTITMNTVFGDRRPNLLVLDEIDGALNSAKDSTSLIKFLVNLATASSHYKTGDNIDIEEEDSADDQDESAGGIHIKSKRQSPKKLILKRPIICICNDPYIAALRPLRKVSEHVIMSPPPIMTLVNRATTICHKEGLTFDPRALLKLVQSSQGDIRLVLSTLQFLKSKRSDKGKTQLDFSLEFFESGHWLGRKDIVSGHFSLLEEIFFMKPMKAYTHTGYSYTTDSMSVFCSSSDNSINGVKSTEASSKSERLLALLERQDMSSLDRLFEGCFEHFLSCQFYDHQMMKLNSLYSDWFLLKDRHQTLITKDPFLIGVLYPYRIYPFVIISKYFAASSNPPLQRTLPQQSYSAFSKFTENKAILQEFLYNSTHNGNTLSVKEPFFTLNWPSLSAIRLDYLSAFMVIFETTQNILLKDPKCIKKCLANRLQFTTLLTEFPALGKFLSLLLSHDVSFRPMQRSFDAHHQYSITESSQKSTAYVSSSQIQYSISPPIDKLLNKKSLVNLGEKTMTTAGANWQSIMTEKDFSAFCQFINNLVTYSNCLTLKDLLIFLMGRYWCISLIEEKKLCSKTVIPLQKRIYTRRVHCQMLLIQR